MNVEHLSPATLRDLASAIEHRSPEARLRRTLTPAGVERLADILLCGGTPTIGFWRRHSTRPAHERHEP